MTIELKHFRVRAAAVALALLACMALCAQTKKAKKPAPTPQPVASDQTPFPIESLSVSGNRLYPAHGILVASGLQVGQPGDKAIFDAARERILATGAFLSVGYNYVSAKDGKGYAVTFAVEEVGQVYPVMFDNLPATDAELRSWLKQKDPMFETKISATDVSIARYKKLVAEYLATKDYHEPLDARLSPENPPDLVVLVRPAAARPSVARVQFADTGELSPAELVVRFYGTAVGTVYSENDFRQLLEGTIRPVYEAHGRLDVKFTKIETAPSKEVKGIDVMVHVDQGPVYRFGSIGFTGGTTSVDELRRLAQVKKGEIANFDEAKAGQERIAASMRHGGYLKAKSQIARTVHQADKTVDIVYQIDPGPQFVLGKLKIVGLTILTEPTVRKMWGLQEGKPFNTEYPNHFLDRVKEDNIFENLKSTHAETKVNDDTHTVDVTLYFNQPDSNQAK